MSPWKDVEELPADAKAVGKAVSEVTGVPMEMIFGKTGWFDVSMARHLVWYILVKKNHNMNRVANFCGVDRKAVVRGFAKIAGARKHKEVSEPMERIKEILKS